MRTIDLPVQARQRQTKNANRRMRRAGQLPGILYGGKGEARPLSVDMTHFGRIIDTIHGMTIFNLQFDGKKTTEQAIIRELQRDPVYDTNLIHIDFYRIETDKPIVVELPIHGVGGVPEGVKVGGVLETLTRRVTAKCLPLEVPDAIEIDVSELLIGQSLHVSDLKAPEGVEFMSEPGTAIFIVAAPRTEEEEVKPEDEEAVEGEEAAEGEEAKEGEEGAGGDDKKDKKDEKGKKN